MYTSQLVNFLAKHRKNELNILNQGLKPAWDAIALHKRDPYQFSSLDQLLLRGPGKMKIESNIAMVEE